MHEASIALDLVRMIEATLAREQASKAIVATVEIGALSHVDPDALTFAFESAVGDGPARGCLLRLERPDGLAHCLGCGADVALAARGDPCSQCGSHKLLVTEGDGLKLRSVEVA